MLFPCTQAGREDGVVLEGKFLHAPCSGCHSPGFTKIGQEPNVGPIAHNVGQKARVFAPNLVSILTCLWFRSVMFVVRYSYRYHYYLTPTDGCEVTFKEPSLGELARVIKAGACIEASFKRGKGEVGMDEYQVRTWEGWHHHMALSLMAVWFLIGETHRGQQLTPALTLPQVRYGLSLLLWEVFCTSRMDYICRQVHRQLQRNESARFYHYRTRKCIPPRKLRREIQ
jgi:hypothetical protein